MSDTTLHDGWSLRVAAGDAPDPIAAATVPATVPGTVHTDLLDAGLIDDPFTGDGEARVRWMWDVDWDYRRELVIAPAATDERVDLVIEGLDTVATVTLGDRVLAETANMHRSYRLDVRDEADGAPRDLAVAFMSATRYADEQVERLGARPGANSASTAPFTHIRKMACSFGWDWGPDLRTAGIWRPVRLHRWRTARLAVVRPLADLRPDGVGTVRVHIEIERSGLVPDGDLRVRAEVAGAFAEVVCGAGADAVVLDLEVPDAPAWWPVGYGAQPLHDLTVTLHDDGAGRDGEPLDTFHRRIGFRHVELRTEADEHGTGFVLEVNRRPIQVRGVNWIPDDHLLTRLTRERVERRQDQAIAANVNLLRVWGGGVYESRDFYEAADERGLLVWQDFLLACGAYPEEEPLRSEIAAEAREHVTRLAPHPSLVIWNGGNENLWGHEDWGWKERLAGLTWGEHHARVLLPGIVAELDPTRPYNDNSPGTPGRAPEQVHPNDPDHGTHHQWQVWNRLDYTAYRDDVPRFCSEFGFQGPPTSRTIADHIAAADGGALADAPDPRHDPVWLLHQKAVDGNGKLDRGMAPHLGVPARWEDWLWAGQLNQARALAHAIGHYRSWWPRTAGAIVWQLNDCWPVTSWALIDSLERRKPAWYAVRRAFAPRLLEVVERDGAGALALVNDTDEPWAARVRLTRESVTGEVAAAVEHECDVAPRAVGILPLPASVADLADPTREVITATADDLRVVHGAVEDVDLALAPDALAATARAVPGGYEVTLRARSLVRDATLLADRVAADAVVDDALVTLPAGATATLRVSTTAQLDPEELLRPDVLRSANDLRGVPVREPAPSTLPPPPGPTPTPTIVRTA
ncbi:glycoside hydrolase family 2 protein [Litorihabitans aurantiacus]|uniref:beta-mannosidase n=1 Tax=Litorihabitans aurantiacus TaxID=1930061 RepID=A0AA37XGR9_9MICO|nr:glycoside hydrolase family 2 protein [Litorihabitans aurantiacus]GMA32894.1 beta-mannosidase [Litorihabitans aurantiacus]